MKINKQIFCSFIFIAFLLTVTGSALASDVNVEKVGGLGDVINAVDVVGHYAYVGQGQNLLILDVTNPSSPTSLSKVTIGGVSNVKVYGNYAYITSHYLGLVIVDISNPLSPTIVGSCDIDGYVWDVAIVGNYAYVANDDNGLIIVDISNPSSPTLVGSYDTDNAWNVAVAGNYAYVPDGYNGLLIIDISNPLSPTIVGSCDIDGYVWDVAIVGNYAYLADGDLVIVDISNPISPTLVGSCDTDGAWDVAVAGNYAYIANKSQGLSIIDISNPSSPTLVGSYDTDEAWDVAVAGNYAYIADLFGFIIVDISTPSLPTLASSFNNPFYLAENIAIAGNYACVSTYDNSLLIVDISNPISPTLVGSYDTGNYVQDIAIAGNYAYLITSYNGLVIVDISNPSSPNLVGSCDIANAWDVAIEGNYAYVSDDNSLIIVDISNPSLPTIVGSYDTVGNIAIADNYAYIAGSDLVIVDISNPISPTLVSSYDTDSYAQDITIAGNYAYLATSQNGLVIIDISNPSSPTFEGTYDNFLDSALNANAKDVAVTGNYAYVVTSENYLLIIDISNPKLPILAKLPTYVDGSYTSDARDVAVAGNYAYVADLYGLIIFKANIQNQMPIDGSLVQVEGNPDVYLIENGMKHRFTSPESLLWNGYSFDSVTSVTSETLQKYPTGQDISIIQPIIDKYHALGGEPIFGASLGEGEKIGDQDSAGTYCSYVNFENGSIECFKNGERAGKAYAVFNPLYSKWASMGYAKSVLGYPIDNMSNEETSKFGTKFRYQNFANGTEKGALEYNLNSGEVFEIHGAIFAKWGALGYVKGIVGLVTSDEKVADISPQGTVGKYSEFENGCIHWISNKEGENENHLQRGQSFVTYGDLNKMYDEMGGTGSELGFPIEDQRTNADGHDYCEFEGGSIGWDDTIGSYIVKLNLDTSKVTCELVPLQNGNLFKKGETVAFKGNAAGGSLPYEYTWIIDGSQKVTGTDEYANLKLSPGEHTIILRVFDSQGQTAESVLVNFKVYTKKVAVVPVKFADSGTISDPSFDTIERRCNLIQQYYSNQSYGAEYIVFDYYRNGNNIEEDGWFRLAKTTSEFKEAYGSAINDENYDEWYSFWQDSCNIAGIKESYIQSNYDTVMVLFNPNLAFDSFDFRSYGSADLKMAMCDSTDGYGTYAHELGHSLYRFRDKYLVDVVNGAGDIGAWGLMGNGNTNPPSPIIGFEKIQENVKWLPSYKEISQPAIGSSGEEHTMSYLDDSDLRSEGLLRLEPDYPGLSDISILPKYYLFEGRRLSEKDSTPTESFVSEDNNLFYSSNKGIVIYNVDNDGMIWRELPNIEGKNTNSIENYEVTVSPEKGKPLAYGLLEATCSLEGDNVKLKIEPVSLENMASYSLNSMANNLYDFANSVNKKLSFSAPDNSTNLDMDLHIITDDGRRIGIDYTNNMYYNEIEGALTSGNLLGGGPEWITVPQNINVTAYVTLSPDLKTILENNSSASIEVNVTHIVFDGNGKATQSEPITIKINSTNLKDQYQIPLIINPPSGVTNLQSTNGTTWLNWTWINPKDSDFNHTEIYLNGIFQTNISAEFFNVTGLEPETSYTIGTRTADISGNVNETWINSTATTLKEPITIEAGSNQTVEEGASANFEGSFAASGSHTYSYHWNFGDGSEEDSSLTTSHTYADDGSYTVNLTVTDEEGNFGNDTLLVTVNNAIPVVNAGSDLEVTAGDLVSVSGTFSDPGWLDTHTAEWNFGEGTVEAGSVSEENESPDSTGTVSGKFSYFDAGSYTVVLKVSDDDGGIGQDQATVIVRPIAATVNLDPDTLNLGSGGNWVTAYIELPAGYSVSGIDIGNVLLNGVVPAVSDSKYGFVTNENEYLKDLDRDGIPERMFKFNREEIESILKAGDQVTVTFTGKVEYNNGISSGMASFEGSDIIKVIQKDSKKDKTK